jgi:DNA mismatch repair protein MutS
VTSTPSDAPKVSLLYLDASTTATLLSAPEGEALRDLHLDQIVASVARRRTAHDLAPVFRARLTDPDEVSYRQEVFRDLEAAPLVDAIGAFGLAMQRVHRFQARAQDPDGSYAGQSWYLQAGRVYVDAVLGLGEALEAADLRSRALVRFRDHLGDYLASDGFRGLASATREVAEQLTDVHYRLHLNGPWIEVSRDEERDDLTAEVAATFARFREDSSPRVPTERRSTPGLDHIETMILDRVAQLFVAEFEALRRYQRDHPRFIDPTVALFDEQAQFYLAFLEFVAPLRRAGLPLCFPELSAVPQRLRAREAYDLALADQLVTRGEPVVHNDLELTAPERIWVVSGANQGGKTTFARTVGQLHHLASLGCPVPAKEAELFLPDRILTHFGRGEQLEDRRGRLQDDLVRVHELLELAGPRSLVITNELFRSTTLVDATVLGRRILERLIAKQLVAVFVTFIDELSTIGPETVSLVATVDPSDPAVRTFRVLRQPADGRAYAFAIADKHQLTYEQLRARMAR